MASGNWGVFQWRIGRSSESRPRPRCAGRPRIPERKKISVLPGNFLNLHSQTGPPDLPSGLPISGRHAGKRMPETGHGPFIDPDDSQASLRQARIDLLTTPQGPFKAHLTWITLHHLHLVHSEEDLPRIAYLSLAPAMVILGFATRPDPPMLWGGMELRKGDLIFHGRGEKFHQRTTGPCGWSLLGLTPEHLERYGGALTGTPLSPPAAMRTLRPAARDAARLRRLHAQACRLAETRPKVLAHPEVARAIEQGLIHALVTCLAAKAQDPGAARGDHIRMMVRFEEVLADHPNQPLHMPELCGMMGMTG